MAATTGILCPNVHEARILEAVQQHLRFILNAQRHGKIEIEVAGRDKDTQVRVTLVSSTQTNLPI